MKERPRKHFRKQRRSAWNNKENKAQKKNAGPKERYAKEKITKSNTILQRLVFNIMSCQKMNELFVLGYMKTIQNQLSF